MPLHHSCVVLQTINLVLTIIFTLELIFKQSGTGLVSLSPFVKMRALPLARSLQYITMTLHYVMMQTINLVLTIIFTLELIIKHTALGLLGYWSDPYNDLDGVIVIASLVDLGLQYSNISRSHGGGGVSSLRILRLLRVLRSMKLLRQVEGLNKIMNIVLKASCRSSLICL